MTPKDRNPTDQATTAFPIPLWLSACIVTGTFLTLAILERRRPLRRTVEPGLQRTGRNLAIATLGAIAVHLAETPIVARAAAMVERRGRVPALWRFHAVHHIDLDLDASTAVRFHFGELTLSTPWRVAQVVAIGTSPLALSIWQTGVLASILFHHSNLELPLDVERRLSRVIVTPRMHGIHH